MYLFRVIIPERDDILIRADDLHHQPNYGRLVFEKEGENVAIFQLSNIVGYVQVDEYGDQ
ncbi:MAG: hypothetical protein K5707_08260 [Clostridia bacterium]|nr:hypothetical protein [Clostridia bacterium]